MVTRELTCITCPMGCRLVAEIGTDGELAVSGNRCPRGAAYAREELLAPKRTVTATCRAARSGSGVRRIPCRTALPFPKELVSELLGEIYALEVALPVERGSVLLGNALDSGIDVIATRTLK
jgi:CxxC motif-containing protein